MIATLFRSARKQGVSLPALRSRLRQWLELQPPDHFLLVEPDEELRRIVTAEIAQAVTFPVMSCGLEDCLKALDGSIPVVLPNRVTTVRQALPDGTELLACVSAPYPRRWVSGCRLLRALWSALPRNGQSS
jgi:GntR family transcriptional regulator